MTKIAQYNENLNINGVLSIKDGSQGAGKILTSDSGGTATWVSSSGLTGFTSGSGTTNYLARWTSPSNLGVGLVTDNNIGVGVNITPQTNKLLSIDGAGITGDTLVQGSWGTGGNGDRTGIDMSVGTGSNSGSHNIIGAAIQGVNFQATDGGTHSLIGAKISATNGSDYSYGTGEFISLSVISEDAGSTGPMQDAIGINVSSSYISIQPTTYYGVKIDPGMGLPNNYGVYILGQNNPIYNDYGIVTDTKMRSGFGILTPTATAHVKGSGDTSAGVAFKVDNSATTIFHVREDRRIIYTDGNQSSGNVLVSDTNGVATWSSSIGGASISEIGFSSGLDSNIQDQLDIRSRILKHQYGTGNVGTGETVISSYTAATNILGIATSRSLDVYGLVNFAGLGTNVRVKLIISGTTNSASTIYDSGIQTPTGGDTMLIKARITGILSTTGQAMVEVQNTNASPFVNTVNWTAIDWVVAQQNVIRLIGQSDGGNGDVFCKLFEVKFSNEVA